MLTKVLNKLVKTLSDKGYTLATAESMTCGLIADFLGSVKGISDVYAGGIVAYSEEMKKELMGVKASTLKKHTAESQEVTDEMATSLRKLVHAEVCAAITGLATSGGSESQQKPVGTVFISVLIRKRMYRFHHRYYGKPDEIKRKAARDMFQLILINIE